MVAIEIELLAGRYAATEHNDRGRAEWPPHPSRLFSALVDALHHNDPVDDRERDALLWLEEQPPPALDVDLTVKNGIGHRRVMEVYVPVNDVTLTGSFEREVRDAEKRVQETQSSGKRSKEFKSVAKKLELANQRMSAALAVDEDPSKKALATAVAILPSSRIRQVRTFPVVFPERNVFTFVWSIDVPADLALALQRLCTRVTRLGHSSSLVRCALCHNHVKPNLFPDDQGDVVLRTVGPGQLRRLEDEHARHQSVDSRFLPARVQRYAPIHEIRERRAGASGVFDEEWIIFERIGGARPMSSRTSDVARALRSALIEQHGSKTLPSILIGHQADGAPAKEPHVAFVALPFVNHTYADGSIQGCAIVLPRGLERNDRELLLRLVAKLERERGIDKMGTLEIATATLPASFYRRVDLPSKASLSARRWCLPSRRFITATPIALDRNPGNLRSNVHSTAHKASIEAQKFIADACEHIGLPRPVKVEISLSPLLSGAQHVKAFRPWPNRPGVFRRVRVHAEICFAQLVRGPVILGGGRYFGLGICLPVET